MTTSNTHTSKFTWQHFGVIGLGAVVFVLLLFADSTTLDNAPPASSRGNEAADTEPMIPPTNNSIQVQTDNAALQEKITQLEAASDPEAKKGLLKEIVEGLQAEGNTLAAAEFAGQLADLDPTGENYLVAGALHRFASHLPDVKTDSVKYTAQNRAAIELLQKAVDLEPKNEGALIELGLAHIESGVGGMTGILKLREVLEINPNNVEAIFHLGKFSYDTGQFDKAVSRFESLLKMEPENMLAKYYLGLSQAELGNRNESKKIMEGLAQQTQDSVIAAKARSFLQNN